jgi:hypothetical protein
MCGVSELMLAADSLIGSCANVSSRLAPSFRLETCDTSQNTALQINLLFPLRQKTIHCTLTTTANSPMYSQLMRLMMLSEWQLYLNKMLYGFTENPPSNVLPLEAK